MIERIERIRYLAPTAATAKFGPKSGSERAGVPAVPLLPVDSASVGRLIGLMTFTSQSSTHPLVLFFNAL